MTQNENRPEEPPARKCVLVASAVTTSVATVAQVVNTFAALIEHGTAVAWAAVIGLSIFVTTVVALVVAQTVALTFVCRVLGNAHTDEDT